MLRVVTGHAGRCRLKVIYPRANIWRAVTTALPVVNGNSQRSGRWPGSLPRASRFLLSGRLTGQCQLQEFHVNSSLGSASPSTADGRLIYVGNLAKTVLGVKFFSYSTSMFSLFAVPYVMFKTGVGVDSMALQIAFYSIMGFFTFVTPVTLHLLTKGYVVRLYHKPETDTYTAVTYNVFLAEKRTVFHQKDVEVPGVSKMFTTFYAQSKSMLVNPMLFFTPQEYSHLMGYDKAFTFDMEELKDLEDK